MPTPAWATAAGERVGAAAGFCSPALRLPEGWQALAATACIAQGRCPACQGVPRSAAGGGGTEELEKILGGQTSGLEEGSRQGRPGC